MNMIVHQAVGETLNGLELAVFFDQKNITQEILFTEKYILAIVSAGADLEISKGR